eukprot:281408-Alexandrium_andersonii.AAC.1
MSAREERGLRLPALERLHSVAVPRLGPDVIACNSAASACERGPRWQTALELPGAWTTRA